MCAQQRIFPATAFLRSLDVLSQPWGNALLERAQQNMSNNEAVKVNVYDNCRDCDALRESLSAEARSYYDKLETVHPSTSRCACVAYPFMLGIMTNNMEKVRSELRGLASCGGCVLNYKLAKIDKKMGEIGERGAINYYRTWVERDIWNLLPLSQKWKLYREVNRGWFYPTVATLLGFSPLIFKTKDAAKAGSSTRSGYVEIKM